MVYRLGGERKVPEMFDGINDVWADDWPRHALFSARWSGWCTWCGAGFCEDDLIGYVDDEIACEGCVNGE
jgi:hypothetical protein